MILLGSLEFKGIINNSAALRGAKKFKESIALVESHLDELHSDCLLNAYREIFLASSEAGLQSKAHAVAQLLYKIDPELPSIQQYLQR